jgi:hypothetical protein
LDRLYGREIVNTVQCFLDARGSALPVSAAHARAAKGSVGTQDEYPSLGFQFSEGDFAALGDTGPVTVDVHKELDSALAKVRRRIVCNLHKLLETIISPSIYHLVSTLLTTTGDLSPTRKPDLQAFLRQLTKCWVDCASVVVVEHSLHVSSKIILRADECRIGRLTSGMASSHGVDYATTLDVDKSG